MCLSRRTVHRLLVRDLLRLRWLRLAKVRARALLLLGVEVCCRRRVHGRSVDVEGPERRHVQFPGIVSRRPETTIKIPAWTYSSRDLASIRRSDAHVLAGSLKF